MISSSKISPLQAIAGHFETLAPYLFRKVNLPKSELLEITLSDGDFVEAEFWSTTGSNKLAILTHGLEGNSGAGYIRALTKLLLEKGFSVLAWNFRGCSGKMNTMPRLYHSGAYEDLRDVVSWAFKKMQLNEIQLFGFSLGGNLSLVAGAKLGKYWFDQHHVSKITAISVPLDLAGCALKLEKPWNKPYTWNFLLDLKSKIQQKALQFPQKINPENLKKSTSLRRFDDYYTAPLHGFLDAADYYKKCSSLFQLESISIQTKIILAKNDPMISRGFFEKMKLNNQLVEFNIHESGGHCGFWGKENLWIS